MVLIKLKTRGVGVTLLLMGLAVVLAYFLAPVPEFEELARRTGVVEDVRRERITFCRRSSGDCRHTVVQVRHEGGSRNYNFAQTDPDEIAIGAAIELWVAPSIKGLDDDRVWHAEQGGRIVRDYERQARADRRIIGIMLPLAPFLIFGGWWLVRHYDWKGDPVEGPSSTSRGLVGLAMLMWAGAAFAQDTPPDPLACQQVETTDIHNDGVLVGAVFLGPGVDLHAYIFDGDGYRDLGNLGGDGELTGVFAQPLGIDDLGRIFGQSLNRDLDMAGFVWERGAMREIPGLSKAIGMTTEGAVIGQTGQIAARWTPEGGAEPLPRLGGEFSQADAVNGAGSIVGASSTSDGPLHAVRWSDGEVIDLGPASGTSMAVAINKRGDIAGWFEPGPRQRHAAVWRGDRFEDLGTFGADFAMAIDIDDAGRVLVVATTIVNSKQVHRNLIVGEDRIVELDNPDGRAQARAMNDQNVVLGIRGTTPIVWADGVMHELPLPDPCRPPEAPEPATPERADETLDTDAALAQAGGDGVDLCPNTESVIVVDSRGCPVDTDGDGVPDGVDECPSTAPRAEVGKDGCEPEYRVRVPNRADVCGSPTRSISFSVGDSYDDPAPIFVQIILEEQGGSAAPKRSREWSVRGAFPYKHLRRIELRDGDSGDLLYVIPLSKAPHSAGHGMFGLQFRTECHPAFPCYEGAFQDSSVPFLELFATWLKTEAVIVIDTTDPEIGTITIEAEKQSREWAPGEC